MIFARFIAGPFGRWLRAVLGAALVILGYLMHSPGGLAVLAIGLIALFVGIFDLCIFAPFFGLPIQGKLIRKTS